MHLSNLARRRLCLLLPKGKNASERGNKGEGLIEHQMVTGLRNCDHRDVAPPQFADIFCRVPIKELAIAAVYDSFAARRVHQTLAHGEPFV